MAVKMAGTQCFQRYGMVLITNVYKRKEVVREMFALDLSDLWIVYR